MRRRWYPALAVAAAVALSVIAYRRLPEQVPLHWGLGGEVDRWGDRWEGAVVLPIVMLVLWGAMRFLPRIDPRGENYAKMQSTYDLLVNAVLTLLLVLHALILGVALGYELPMERIVPALVGVLFVVIGNVLPRARPNWWFGIRTPWTLSNDRVWTRTHRLGGYAMTVSPWNTSVAACAGGAPALALTRRIVLSMRDTSASGVSVRANCQRIPCGRTVRSDSSRAAVRVTRSTASVSSARTTTKVARCGAAESAWAAAAATGAASVSVQAQTRRWSITSESPFAR